MQLYYQIDKFGIIIKDRYLEQFLSYGPQIYVTRPQWRLVNFDSGNDLLQHALTWINDDQDSYRHIRLLGPIELAPMLTALI